MHLLKDTSKALQQALAAMPPSPGLYSGDNPAQPDPQTPDPAAHTDF